MPEKKSYVETIKLAEEIERPLPSLRTRRANNTMQIRTNNIKARRLDRRHPATFVIADGPIQPGGLNPNHVLTPEQLAERLKVQVSWVYEQTRKRAGVRNADPLPSIRLGKYLRFYWPEIEKWLAARQGKGGRKNA